MPVEIRELQITTIVGNTSAQPKPTSASAPAPNMDAIIAQCVEQVLSILKEKNER